MQQFTIPQFIDVEDKVIGPITARQFIIMLGGFMLIAIFYKLVDFSLFLFLSIITMIFVSAFAFGKINGRPFHFFVLNLIQTLKKPNLRVWSRVNISLADDDLDSRNILQNTPPASKKHYTNSRLAELSLIVDTSGAFKGIGKDGEVKELI